MARFDQQIGARRDEVGAGFADLRAKIESGKDETAVITATTVDVPVVDNTFSPIFSRGKKKNKIRVTLRYANFGTGIDIKVVLVPRALILTSDDYDQQRITTRLAEGPFTQDIIATQLVTSAMVQEFEPNTQYDIIRLVSIGEDAEDRAINPDPDPVFASYPGNILYTFTTPAAFGAPSAPHASLIVFNRLDEHTPDEGDAEVGLKVYAPLTDGGAAQTWGASGALWVKCWLTRGITGDVTPEQLPFQKLLSETELTQTDPASSPANRGFVIIVCNNLKAGAPYIWTDNVAYIAGDKATSSASIAFNAANFSNDLSGLTGVSLTFDNTPPYDDLLVSVDLNLTQPTVVRAMRNFTLKRKLSTDGSFPAVNVIDRSDKVNSDAYHVASTAFVIRLAEIKVKPSKTYNIQVILRGRGNATPLTINGTFTTSASGAVLSDTAVPTLSTNPDTGTTGPTVSERHSKIDISCPLPSANINTLDNYQVILSTSNVAPDPVDPTVGVDGVLVIKYGQNPTFNLSYFADFGDQFWVMFRAHNGIGYSSWSAATNQDGYSRPLQDFIGDAVPDNSEGLVRTGTGSGVSTTVFQLDGSASAVNDFYNGNAINFLSPGTSSPNQDSWRTITDYDGSTKRVTLDAALSSTPGAITFVISAIDVPGDRASKSGTGHSTTTFILESAASSADDFYLGYTLYIPTMATASDRIRKVAGYVGASRTITVDIAFGTAPSGNLGYLLVNGSVGFSSPNLADSLTEPGVPVPFRWYLNANDLLVFEILPPIGENAFSLTHFQIQSKRRNVAMPVKDDSGAVAIVSGTGYKTDAAPGGTFWASSIRFRNMFREGGSDGWGVYSYFVSVLSAGGSPNYDPETFGDTVIVDYQGEDSYPTQRYPSYL